MSDYAPGYFIWAMWTRFMLALLKFCVHKVDCTLHEVLRGLDKGVGIMQDASIKWEVLGLIMFNPGAEAINISYNDAMAALQTVGGWVLPRVAPERMMGGMRSVALLSLFD